MNILLSLPKAHVEDWWRRCGSEYAGTSRVMGTAALTIQLSLSQEALDDLVLDARTYAEGGADTENHRLAAERCLAKLIKLGYGKSA